MWCIPFSFSPSPRCIVAKRTSESTVAPKMKGIFYSKPNIRMCDIWETSNELEHQGSSKLIWFAPGHSKKPLVFPPCRSSQGKNKEGSLVSKDPFFLLIRNLQLALWKVDFVDLHSSSIRNLMTVHKCLWKQKQGFLSANISLMLTFPFCCHFEYVRTWMISPKLKMCSKQGWKTALARF